jgi:ParB family chromosome partitioning protein
VGATRKTTRKKATRKKSARKKAGTARKRLTPSKEKRGLGALDSPLSLDDPALRELVAAVETLGGSAVGSYREPLSGSPLLVAVVPVSAIEPTPFQRDLSTTHAKRLASKIDEARAYLDPVTAVLAPDGRLWTPNGRHRLAAAKVLGLKSITVLISPDAKLAFRILALNTEKAHNLRDRSLEVIRMARALADQSPRAREIDHEEELESAALLTLGIAYEQNKRFPGSAYHPMLRRVDTWSSKTFRGSLQEREGWAARLMEIESRVKEIIADLQARGFRSPYLRAYVVARLNPVRPPGRGRAKEPPSMTLPAALTRMAAAARRFDADSVRERDLTLVAAVAPVDEA